MNDDENVDPRLYFGPGVWYSLHLLAAKKGNTPEGIQAVLLFIESLTEQLFCEKCRQHFSDFVNNNSPQEWVESGKDIFDWTWKAHNNANRLTGKKQFSLTKAKTMFGLTPGVQRSCSSCNVQEDSSIFSSDIQIIDIPKESKTKTNSIKIISRRY